MNGRTSRIRPLCRSIRKSIVRAWNATIPRVHVRFDSLSFPRARLLSHPQPAGRPSLEQRGLDRIREKDKDGFARMVALSILAANVHRIGVIVRDRQREQLKKRRLLRAA